MKFSTYAFPEPLNCLETKLDNEKLNKESKELFTNLLSTSFYKGFIIRYHNKNNNLQTGSDYKKKFEEDITNKVKNLNPESNLRNLAYKLALYSFSTGYNGFQSYFSDKIVFPELDDGIKKLLEKVNK